MAGVIKKLRAKGLIAKKKIPFEEFFELDLNDPDDMLFYITERLLSDLHNLMMTKKINYSELAEKMGLSRQAVSKNIKQKNVTIPWVIKAILILGGMIDMSLFLPNQSVVSRAVTYEESPVIPLSKRFAMLRRKMNVSIANLAKTAELKASDLEAIEDKGSSPDDRTVKRLARVFMVPERYLRG